MKFSAIFSLQVIRGLLKFWPKTCSQKEVISMSRNTLHTCANQLLMLLHVLHLVSN